MCAAVTNPGSASFSCSQLPKLCSILYQKEPKQRSLSLPAINGVGQNIKIFSDFGITHSVNFVNSFQPAFAVFTILKKAI
jgi:hypothetical protein